LILRTGKKAEEREWIEIRFLLSWCASVSRLKEKGKGSSLVVRKVE